MDAPLPFCVWIWFEVGGWRPAFAIQTRELAEIRMASWHFAEDDFSDWVTLPNGEKPIGAASHGLVD